MPIELVKEGTRKTETHICPSKNCMSRITLTYETTTQKIVSCSEQFEEDIITCQSCGSQIKWTPPTQEQENR